MATQISAMRITWVVLTDLVLVRTDARNEPRSSSALGATPLDDQDCSVTAVAPMPSPIEPRPIARFVHAATAGWMPRCASLASTCLSISELILSTSPSATAPSYSWPSSVCTAAAAATSSRARTSIQPSYIAIECLTTCYVAAELYCSRTPVNRAGGGQWLAGWIPPPPFCRSWVRQGTRQGCPPRPHGRRLLR